MSSSRATKRKIKYFIKDNSGVLFLADSPKGKQPNMRGTINIDGIYYDVSGWFHKKKNSEQQYLVLRVKRQTERPTNGRGTPKASSYKYSLKSNQGMLFPLPLLGRREFEDKHLKPNMRGSLNVGGTLYDLSAWIKSSKKPEIKKKFISINLTKHDLTREYLLESILSGDSKYVPAKTRSKEKPKDADTREPAETGTSPKRAASTGSHAPSSQHTERDSYIEPNIGGHSPSQIRSFSKMKESSTIIPNDKASGREDSLSQPVVPSSETDTVEDSSSAGSRLPHSQDDTGGNGASISTQVSKDSHEETTRTDDWDDSDEPDDLPF